MSESVVGTRHAVSANSEYSEYSEYSAPSAPSGSSESSASSWPSGSSGSSGSSESSCFLLLPLASSKSSPSLPLPPDTTLYIIYKATTMKVISTDKAPAAIGPYSQAIEANGMVFCSGQIPIDPATGTFVEGGIQEQTRQVLTNASQVLAAAGTDLSHVVKTTVFLSDMANFVAMNEVYAQFFSQPFPARSAVAVKDLPKGALVEIEVLAVK